MNGDARTTGWAPSWNRGGWWKALVAAVSTFAFLLVAFVALFVALFIVRGCAGASARPTPLPAPPSTLHQRRRMGC